MAVGEGGQRRHLGDQPDRRHVALLGVVDVLGVGVEGRQRPDAGEQHAHRVGVVAEPLEQELLDVLVDEGVVGDVEDPALELGLGRQLAEDEQVGDLEVARVLAQLLDRVAAVLEDPRLAVDEGDRRAARGGVGERRVVGHQAEVVVGDLDLAQVHRLHGPVGDLELVGLAGAVVGDRQRVRAGGGHAAVACWLGLLLGGHRLSSLAARFLSQPQFSHCARWPTRPLGGVSGRVPARWPPSSVGSERKRGALELFAGLSAATTCSPPLLSFGQDPRWRRAMVAAVGARPDERVLDVATGTGLVARALVRRYGCSVVGLDQSAEMLAGARRRLAREPRARGADRAGAGRGRAAAVRRRASSTT